MWWREGGYLALKLKDEQVFLLAFLQESSYTSSHFPLVSMKKISLLLSTLGGAMGGYLLSNKKLREELMKAKDAETAAKTLGKHLQRDGMKIAGQVREFVESEDVQLNIAKAKQFAKKKADEARRELSQLVACGKNKAKTQVKKTAAQAKMAAAKTARRVKAKTRKLS